MKPGKATRAGIVGIMLVTPGNIWKATPNAGVKVIVREPVPAPARPHGADLYGELERAPKIRRVRQATKEVYR